MAARSRMASPLRPPPTSPPAPPAAGSQAEPPAPGAAVPRSQAVTTLPPLRPLTGYEEEFLEEHQHDANTARLCNEVLARCLVPPGADHTPALAQVRSLLVAERDRALLELRRISLGPQISGQVDCPNCAKPVEAEFSLDALAIDVPEVPREIQTLVEGTGVARLRLPTAGDQEDLLEVAPGTESARRSWMLGRCLLDLAGHAPGGPDGDDTARVGFARALPVPVRRQLESALEDALPGLDLEMALECPHCARRFIAPFDVQLFFFRIEPAHGEFPARGAPARAGLPLERTGYPRPAAASPPRLPAAAGTGRRRRPAARPDCRRRPSLTPPRLIQPGLARPRTGGRPGTAKTPAAGSL